MPRLRQPIITVLGHVDHGKTSLLDKIRQTIIAQKEAGGITQAIGATQIPTDVIKNISGRILEKFRFVITIPGLLFIDTPGHEAFSTLRKRGGSIADLAILVVDIVEGFMPQTDESIAILKEAKVPFVIAVNKIDRIRGWDSPEMASFSENFSRQSSDVQGEFEEKFYRVVEQAAGHGFAAERYDRMQDFRANVAAIPISSKTGEGIPELLAILAGLSQQFLRQQLTTTDHAKGTILEVKEVTGLGMTIDTIIYDGSVKKNDYLIIGGKNPRIVKIRALLEPEPLRDIRVEKKFQQVEECVAASGVKISAPALDDVIAGSEIRTAATLDEAKALLEEFDKEREEIEVHTETEGLILKADTIGSLEAMLSIFRNHPVKEATIGQITKTDVIKAEANKDRFHRAVIGFNMRTPDDMAVFAMDKNVKLLESNVIYHLIEAYEQWVAEAKVTIEKDELEKLIRPGKLRILPGHVFRASNPAIVGCEVLGGIVKPGYGLFKDDKQVGEIKQIQAQGENMPQAKTGDKVAVSITGPTVGRQIDENDVLYTDMNGSHYKDLLKQVKLLSDNEKAVLEEIKELKRKQDRTWGF